MLLNMTDANLIVICCQWHSWDLVVMGALRGMVCVPSTWGKGLGRGSLFLRKLSDFLTESGVFWCILTLF